MHRVLRTCAFVLPLIMLSAGPAAADVKVRDKVQVKLEGFIGRMAGMFGGKAAKEGIVTTRAVKGDRKSELTESSGRIVDLKEEKLYELNVKNKTYTVTTFEELRRQMREAQEKAEREAPEEEKPQPDTGKDEGKPAREMEVDFDVKETGQTRQIAGYNTREVVMTVTFREKGRTLEDGGGAVMTNNAWMGPVIPAMKEVVDFELRYWKALAPEASGVSAEQMAALMVMYPMLKGAMERMRAEGSKLDGTPLATTMVFEAVKSKDRMAQESKGSGGGGIGGMLARRMAKRDDKPRATVFTVTQETLELGTDVAPGDLAIPEGFKEKK